MGLFDTIKSEIDLRGINGEPLEHFQTKDLGSSMDNYTLTKDGRLMLDVMKLEVVPEEDQPYYGTPKWGKGYPFGQFKETYIRTDDVNYKGTLRMYTSLPSNRPPPNQYTWYEFELTFKKGVLSKIKQIEPLKRPNGFVKALQKAKGIK
jgi:hypothetical protein